MSQYKNCVCERCDAVYSPAAYLLALNRFIEHYYSTVALPKNMDYIFKRMNRPNFPNSKISCKKILNPIPQPKIAERVLLNYIIDKTPLNDDNEVYDELKTSINPPPFYYFGNQLREYFTVLGTSLAEIHTAFEDPNPVGYCEERFAEILGISPPELSRIIRDSNWQDMEEILAYPNLQATIQAQVDKDFLINLFSIRDKIEDLDGNKEPIDFLLENNFIGANGNPANIDKPAFIKMFRLLMLMRALGSDITEYLTLIKLIDPADLTQTTVENVYKKHLMLLTLELIAVDLSKALNDVNRLDQLVKMVNLSREDLNAVMEVNLLNDITSINQLETIWDFVQQIYHIGISVDKFVNLKRSLVDVSVDPLTEILGATGEELLDAINADSNEELAEILGISVEHLEKLFVYKIKGKNGVPITNATDVKNGGISSLDRLYRPVRVAKAIGINIPEFEAILRFLGIPPNDPYNDPNSISYSQIRQAYELANTAGMFGFNLAEIPDLISKSGDHAELLQLLDVNDEWWEDYFKSDANGRIEKLSTQLVFSQDTMKFLIEQIGAIEQHTIKSITSGPNKIYVKDDIQENYNVGNWKLYITSGMKSGTYYTITGNGIDGGEHHFIAAEDPTGLSPEDKVKVVNVDNDINLIEAQFKVKSISSNPHRIFIDNDIQENYDGSNWKLYVASGAQVDTFYTITGNGKNGDHYFSVNEDPAGLAPNEFVKVVSFSDPSRINMVNIRPLWESTDILRRWIGITQQIGINADIFLTNLTNCINNFTINDVDSFYKMCAVAIDSLNINEIITEVFWLNGLADFDTIERVQRIYQLVSLSKYLDLGIRKLKEWNLWEKDIIEQNVIDLIDTELKSRFEELQLEIELKKPEERILEKTRDALVLLAISPNFPCNDGDWPQTIKDLSMELLIDLQIAPIILTTEVLQAIESLQTYVLRVRTGQEKELDQNNDLCELKAFDDVANKWMEMEEDWKWMRRYVLWEAAQKVFLYPENYVMPTLRDNKSEFFQEFEDELSQGEVTQNLAEKAISNYIKKLHSISGLRVTGTVYNLDDRMLHIFSRSQINENESYYRTFKDQRIWSPWIKMPVEINSNRVYPLIAYDRIYLFWIETKTTTEKKGDDDIKTHKHKLCYCYTMEKGKWSKKKTTELDSLLLSDESSTLSTIGTPYLGVVFDVDRNRIVISIGEKHPLLKRYSQLTYLPRNIGKVYEFHLLCNDAIEKYGQTARTPSAFIEEIDLAPDSIYHKPITYFAKDRLSSEASISFMLMTEEIYGQWIGRAVISHSRVKCLYIDQFSTLKFFVADYNNDGKLSNFVITTVFETIDSTFRVDDAIIIGKNTYFFCSDQCRCLMIVAHVTNDICENKKVRFSICQLNYGEYCKMTDKLFQEGLDGLYNPELQFEDISPDFSGIYHPNPQEVISVPPSKLEFKGPNKIYNWELFFHIPCLIADGLGQNRKFEQAVRWYHYIFNPYSDPELSNPDADVTWQFKPFRGEPQEQLLTYLNDPEDIEIWRIDPFSPHALARVRPFTYQKSILLSYIENLLEWADQDFTRDTQESINRARIRYFLAEQLLELPELGQTIPCEHEEWTLLEMNTASVDTASGIEGDAEDFVGGIPQTFCCVPSEWLDPIETIIDPYSLEAMLVNLQVGCIPENPIFESHWRHIESNLRKIRSGRNIAGVRRLIPLFDAAVDPMAIVRAVSSGAGLENLSFSSSANIGPYRFAFLIERAKSLAHLVVQAGNALLSAIEKKETEELSFLRAQQDLKLAKTNIHLKKLSVVEAEDNKKLAELQTGRAEAQFIYFRDLIKNGKNTWEKVAQTSMDISAGLFSATAAIHTAAAIAAAIPDTHIGIASAVVTGGSQIWRALGQVASASASLAHAASVISSAASMHASFKRREEEWKFNRELAWKDKEISSQNEKLADDRFNIAKFEQEIAEMQAEFSTQTLEFLKEKFTNKELYKWMVKTLSKLLYGFYNLAYSTARMAQATMEFERNETYDFISYEYWDSEKKGLLSGDQLLLDLNRMDDAYIQNNVRKLEITKHISLARMVPESLVQLRSDGRTIFTTPMSWFDRDFPGHFQRIIKSVRLSIFALIGPNTNFNSTLSTVSPSQVVLNPEDEEPISLQRIQSVALSGTSSASGLFEFNYRDERYLPFEGCGTAVTWELEMPKPSNQFDFNTIIDVILTIDYTALSDFDYKKTVIEALGTDVSGMLPLTVHNSFPDAWYHFHNPIFQPPGTPNSLPEPYTLVFKVSREMFPPNEEDHSLETISMFFSLTDLDIRLPITIKYTSDKGQVVELTRQTGTDGYLSLESDFNRKSPFGTWEIGINRDRTPVSLWSKNDDGSPRTEQITDPNQSRHLLDTEKIKGVFLSLTYSATLDWPSES